MDIYIAHIMLSNHHENHIAQCTLMLPSCTPKATHFTLPHITLPYLT